MKFRQNGFTLLEIMVVLAIISILIAALYPSIHDAVYEAKIKGAVVQAKEIVTACNLVRISPVSSARDTTTQQVTNTYSPNYASWTDVVTLKARLSTNYALPTVNPFGRPYYFKLDSQTCSVAVELDTVIDSWEGLDLETAGSSTRIIVSTPSRITAAPSWLQHQNRVLFGGSNRL